MGIFKNLSARVKATWSNEGLLEDSQESANVQYAGPELAPVSTQEDTSEGGSGFYSKESLLSSSSSPKHLRRAIENAEAFANKDYPEQAIRIYKSLSQRVDDPELRKKFQSNIRQLGGAPQSSPKKAQEKGKRDGANGRAPKTPKDDSGLPLPKEISRSAQSPGASVPPRLPRRGALKKKKSALSKKEDQPLKQKGRKTEETGNKGKDPLASPVKQDAPKTPKESPKKDTEPSLTKQDLSPEKSQSLSDSPETLTKKVILAPSSMVLEKKVEELDPIDLPSAERLELAPKAQAPPNIIVSPDMRAMGAPPAAQERKSREKYEEDMEIQEFGASPDKSQSFTQEPPPVIIMQQVSSAPSSQPVEIPQQGEQMGKGEAAQGSGASSPVTAPTPFIASSSCAGSGRDRRRSITACGNPPAS